METKLIAMILGVALVLVTAATVYTQSVLAFIKNTSGGTSNAHIKNHGNSQIQGSGNANGVNPCSQPNVADHNPHCALG